MHALLAAVTTSRAVWVQIVRTALHGGTHRTPSGSASDACIFTQTLTQMSLDTSMGFIIRYNPHMHVTHEQALAQAQTL